MTRGSYTGRAIAVPDGRAYDHELDIAYTHAAKFRYTMGVVERFGVRSVVETHAGYAALSVEYAAAGARLVACYERDPARHAALQRNVGAAAYAFDNCRLPADHVFDADLVDMDPFAYAFDTIAANHARFVRPCLLIVTSAIMAYRYNWRRPGFAASMRRTTLGATRGHEIELATSLGRGFSRLAVASFIARWLDVEYVDEMPPAGSTLERALFRVRPRAANPTE